MQINPNFKQSYYDNLEGLSKKRRVEKVSDLALELIEEAFQLTLGTNDKMKLKCVELVMPLYAKIDSKKALAATQKLPIGKIKSLAQLRVIEKMVDENLEGAYEVAKKMENPELKQKALSRPILKKYAEKDRISALKIANNFKRAVNFDAALVTIMEASDTEAAFNLLGRFKDISHQTGALIRLASRWPEKTAILLNQAFELAEKISNEWKRGFYQVAIVEAYAKIDHKKAFAMTQKIKVNRHRAEVYYHIGKIAKNQNYLKIAAKIIKSDMATNFRSHLLIDIAIALLPLNTEQAIQTLKSISFRNYNSIMLSKFICKWNPKINVLIRKLNLWLPKPKMIQTLCLLAEETKKEKYLWAAFNEAKNDTFSLACVFEALQKVNVRNPTKIFNQAIKIWSKEDNFYLFRAIPIIAKWNVENAKKIALKFKGDYRERALIKLIKEVPPEDGLKIAEEIEHSDFHDKALRHIIVKLSRTDRKKAKEFLTLMKEGRTKIKALVGFSKVLKDIPIKKPFYLLNCH